MALSVVDLYRDVLPRIDSETETFCNDYAWNGGFDTLYQETP